MGDKKRKLVENAAESIAPKGKKVKEDKRDTCDTSKQDEISSAQKEPKEKKEKQERKARFKSKQDMKDARAEKKRKRKEKTAAKMTKKDSESAEAKKEKKERKDKKYNNRKKTSQLSESKLENGNQEETVDEVAEASGDEKSDSKQNRFICFVGTWDMLFFYLTVVHVMLMRTHPWVTRQPTLFRKHWVSRKSLCKEPTRQGTRCDQKGRPEAEMPGLCIHWIRKLRPHENLSQVVSSFHFRWWKVPT